MRKFILFLLVITLLLPLLAVTAENAPTVTVSVYENVNNKYILQNHKITMDANETALSALYKCPVTPKDRNGYVYDINGFIEKQHGPGSGWEYKVNGVKPPRAASACKLKDGDVLLWEYITDYKQTDNPTQNQTAKPTQRQTQVPTVKPTGDIQAGTTRVKATQAETKSEIRATGNTAANDETADNTQADMNFAIHTTGNFMTNNITVSDDIIKNSLLYLKNNPGRYTALVLSLYGENIPSSIIKELLNDAKEEDLSLLGAERIIFNLVHAEQDVPQNLIDILLDEKKYENETVNAFIFAILCYNVLDKKDFIFENKKHYDFLAGEFIKMQLEDGSFTVLQNGDPDVTAMALLAINADVFDSFENEMYNSAIDWLISKSDNGMYSSMGDVNCESTAMALTALSVYGYDTENIQEQMMRFYNGEGFRHLLENGTDTMATEQALIALYAVKHNKNPYTSLKTFDVPLLDTGNDLIIYISAVILLTISAGVLYVKKKK